MADGTGTFQDYIDLVLKIEAESKYTLKTDICRQYFQAFGGDLYLLCKLLLAKQDKRVYHLRDKQVIKLLAKLIPGTTLEELSIDLEKGDQSETGRKFLEESGAGAEDSTLSLKEIDDWLDGLSTMTKDEERLPHLKSIFHLLTPTDLKWLLRIIDKDLKINLGPKHVLDAMHKDAHDAYKNSNDLKKVIQKVQKHEAMGDMVDDGVSLFSPVKPMLAKPCKSFDEIWKRCPNGMFAEVKYDGERVQIHKQGDEFQYFSRNLKSVLPHKTEDFAEYLPQALPCDSVILDGEILLAEAGTGEPLPFGTLGVRKKLQHEGATVCLFIFDILYYEGEDLMSKPYSERREFLEQAVKEIKGRIRLAEAFPIRTEDDLETLWQRVLKEGLEGLMIKDATGHYHPAMRHWLKLKKDYLGGMADTADLIVLGSYFGTGLKGGLRSTFLMGVYDEDTDTYKTVCKCANGFDDETLAQLQSLPMVKCTAATIPSWLDVDKGLVPAFYVPDPKKSPVWEIEGAQFTKSERHTAAGISIRFPRIARFRDDKDWSTATTLKELVNLAQESMKNVKDVGDEDDDDDEKPKAKKAGKKAAAAAPKAGPSLPVASPKKPKASGATTAAPAAAANRNIMDAFGISRPGSGGAGPKQPIDAPNGITYVVGDVTVPIGDTSVARALVILIDDSGAWPMRGVAPAVSDKWPKVKSTFEKNVASLQQGAALALRVEMAAADKAALYTTMWVAYHRQTTGMNKLNMESFQSAAQATLEWCNGKTPIKELHFSRPRKGTPGVDWPQIEQVIVDNFISNGIKVYVYSLDAHTDQAKFAKATPAKPSMLIADEEDDDMMDVDEPIPSRPGKANPTTSGIPKIKPAPGTPAALFEDVFEDVNAVLYGQVARKAIIKAMIIADGGAAFEEVDQYDMQRITHVITDSPWDDALGQFIKGCSVKVVQSSWVMKSIEKGNRLDESQFLIKR